MSANPLPTILIIEDDEPTQWLIERHLQCLPVQTISASSASEGKRSLMQNKVDIVICDYHMGDATGLEILKYLKAEKKELPFVLFTAELQSKIPRISYKQFTYVQKPEVDKLLQAVGEYLRSF